MRLKGEQKELKNQPVKEWFLTDVTARLTGITDQAEFDETLADIYKSLPEGIDTNAIKQIVEDVGTPIQHKQQELAAAQADEALKELNPEVQNERFKEDLNREIVANPGRYSAGAIILAGNELGLSDSQIKALAEKTDEKGKDYRSAAIFKAWTTGKPVTKEQMDAIGVGDLPVDLFVDRGLNPDKVIKKVPTFDETGNETKVSMRVRDISKRMEAALTQIEYGVNKELNLKLLKGYSDALDRAAVETEGALDGDIPGF